MLMQMSVVDAYSLFLFAFFHSFLLLFVAVVAAAAAVVTKSRSPPFPTRRGWDERGRDGGGEEDALIDCV